MLSLLVYAGLRLSRVLEIEANREHLYGIHSCTLSYPPHLLVCEHAPHLALPYPTRGNTRRQWKDHTEACALIPNVDNFLIIINCLHLATVCFMPYSRYVGARAHTTAPRECARGRSVAAGYTRIGPVRALTCECASRVRCLYTLLTNAPPIGTQVLAVTF